MAHPIKPTVYRDPMELSQVALLGSQVDMEKFSLTMNHFVGIRLADAITAASVSRTIAGSSVLQVTVLDPDRNFLRSGVFNNKMDVQIDGLWWRFKSLNKQGDFITLTFEEREVALLRLYSKPTPMVSRLKMTRAEFVLKLIKEVKEVDIPYWIPELHDAQPIFNKNDIAVNPAVKQKGINYGTFGQGDKLTVKHVKARPDQLKNAHIILETGDATIPMTLARRRKIMVTGIMTAIQENTLTNSDPYKDEWTSVGLFQQIRHWGWPASGDPATDARAYYQRAIAYDAKNPNVSYNDLAQGVQGSAYPNAYGQWQPEAEAFVDAYGMPGATKEEKAKYSNAQADYGAVAAVDFHFYRGLPPSRKNALWGQESSWTCIQRLAGDVNWRAFFVSGTFYFMAEDDLFKTMPKAVLAEYDEGIDTIDGDYDQNKRSASVSVSLRMGRYDIPPGCVVILEDMGPMNGRWIVESVDRDMYDPSGTLSLKKPDPALAEPRSDQLSAFQKTPTGGKTPLVPGTTPQLPFTAGDIIDSAKKIMHYVNKGQFTGSAAVSQIRKTVNGQPWTPSCTGPVVPNAKLLSTIVWLLDAGWRINCTALCEDHPCSADDPHTMGQAIDIGSIGKVGVGENNIGSDNSQQTQNWIIEMVTSLYALSPRTIICEGAGGIYDADIQNHQWYQGKQYHWYSFGDHRNHVHVDMGPNR